MISEGVVKYSVNHTTKNAPRCLEYAALEQVRTHLFALGLIGESNGIGYGNLSVRDKATSGFFVTATQTGHLSRLSPEHYSYVRHYDVNTFSVASEGMHPPSSEALSHAMLYDIHPDISAVIHIHSLALWHNMRRHHSLATTAAYGTKEMVHEIAELYKDRDPLQHNAFVMHGHREGIMTFGSSLDEAQLRLYAMIRRYLFSE